MNDPGAVVVISGLALCAATVSIRAIAGAVLRLQENKLKYLNAQTSVGSESRLERIEQAIDAIAVEVERISEGQRFTTKLLSERTSRSVS